MKKIFANAFAVVALIAATPALADDLIDTTGGVTPSATGIYPFGSVNTATYGQTFTAGAGDNFLQSFSLFLGDRYSGSGNLDFRGYVGAWDGTAVTSILYTSANQSKSASGLSEFAFNTANLAVASGSQYLAFLSISELSAQPQSTFYMPYGSVNLVGEGFRYLNNGTDFGALGSGGWGSFGESDVAFKASFTTAANGAVPEPATWGMMLLGFGLLGAAMRRKQTARVRFAF